MLNIITNKYVTSVGKTTIVLLCFCCSCKENYLLVGNDCVHENIIIGVSVGVGAALILALIIALVVVGCKYRRKFKKQKSV